MKLRQLRWMTVSLLFLLFGVPLWGASYYTLRPEDPKAVNLAKGGQGAQGDGIADDTDAIQHAIDKIQESTVQGIVFIPEGRYRISKTIFVWPGIRLIGYGAKRPVFVLGKDTPGYQNGIGYMVVFTGGHPDATHPRMRRGESLVGIVPPNDLIPE